MPYTPTSWTSGTTPVDAPEMNNLETQYAQASVSLPPALGIGVVLSGCTGVRDGTTLAQLDFTGGVAYVKQTDNTYKEIDPATQHFTATVPSTTYFLDLNPDGSLSWATSHSAVANHLTLLSATVDSSTHLNVITDLRPRTLNLFPGADSAVIPQLAGDTLAQIKSAGGGAAGQNIWVGTTDPGSNAMEGDIWIKA